MELGEFVDKYTEIAEKHGIVDCFSDSGIYQKEITIGNIRLLYSTYRDGTEDFDTFYGDYNAKKVPKKVMEELLQDLAKYLLSH